MRLTSRPLWTPAAGPPSLSTDHPRCRRTPLAVARPPRCRRTPLAVAGFVIRQARDLQSGGPGRDHTSRLSGFSRCRRTPLAVAGFVIRRAREGSQIPPQPELRTRANARLTSRPLWTLAAAGPLSLSPDPLAAAGPPSPSPDPCAVDGFAVRRARAGSQIPPQPELRTRANARLTSHPLWTIIVAVAGCGAGGSARRLGRRGRRFKSYHPD